MPTVGWIKLGLTVATTNFKKGLHSSAEELRDFKEKITRAAEAFAILEVAKKAFESIKGSIEGISQQKILAERVGLSAEAFGKLSYAAKLAHVDQETLAGSLGQMSKRLGEVAIEGTGPAADALKRFGLSASKLARMGTEGAFFTIVKAMEEIKNPAERSAVAMDLFGKSGQGMINLVAQGSEELKAAGADALRLGAALSDIDTARVEEADQAFIKLGEASQGFVNLLAVQLAPYLTLIIDKYMEWGYSGTKSADFITRGIDMITTGLGYVLDVINSVKVAWYMLQTPVTWLGEVIGRVISAVIDQFTSLITKIGDGVAALARMAGASEDTVNRIKGSFKGAIAGSGLNEAKGFMDAWSDEMNNSLKSQVAAMGKAWDNVGRGKDTVRNLLGEFSAAADQRAKQAVLKSTAFAAPGMIHGAEDKSKRYSGGFEFGTKDAYSAILRAKGITSRDPVQSKIAAATERTAAAVERMANAAKGAGDAPGKRGKMILDMPGAH